MKKYTYERPTYNILTVVIVRSLQAALSAGIIAQAFRLGFFCLGIQFLPGILQSKYYIVYYLYQLIMQVLPFLLEYVYVT